MRVVLTDTNVLINLAHANGLAMLARVPELQFVLPEEVYQELQREDHRSKVDAQINAGALAIVRVDSPEALRIFAELRAIMGAGEAACLAIAEVDGTLLASDEKRAFRREAIRRIGEDQIMTTPSLYVKAINAGIITVQEADDAKRVLAENRFTMPFASFGELL
jgi:predicted nucleic acid-binding protein